MDINLLAADFTRSMVEYAAAQLKGIPEELIAFRKRHQQLLRHPIPFTLQRGVGRELLVSMMKEKFETVIIEDAIGGLEVRFL